MNYRNSWRRSSPITNRKPIHILHYFFSLIPLLSLAYIHAHFFAPKSTKMSAPNSVVWSREEDRAFENAIAMLHCIDDSKEQWQKIALMVPNKTIEELKRHYQLLVDDVTAIENGYVPIPNYSVDESRHGHSRVSTGNWQSNGNGFAATAQYQEKRKGRPWTKEEHRLFLVGLERYGKGDWRSISRNAVISKTPSQVASHAQKYFNRLNSSNNATRRRTSIHDITI